MPRVNATSLTLQRGSYFSLRSKSVKSPHHTVETTHAGHRKVHLTYMYSTLVYISIPAGQSTVASTRTPRYPHHTFQRQDHHKNQSLLPFQDDFQTHKCSPNERHGELRAENDDKSMERGILCPRRGGE